MNKSQKQTLYISIIIILIVIALAILFSFRAYHNYFAWRSYHNYFNQSNPKIESWMTLNMISREFNISHADIIKELNITESINPHLNLDRFCRQYHQNCSKIIDRLNNLAGK